jgi:hypothetical protein
MIGPSISALHITLMNKEKDIASIYNVMSQTINEKEFFGQDVSIMYVRKMTNLLKFPSNEYDSCLAILQYGLAVSVSKSQGGYLYVQSSKGVGWVYKDDVTIEKKDVWPNFSVNKIYDANNNETIKARKLLDDKFLGGMMAANLLPAEYVTIALLHDNRSIDWSQKNGRIPGVWHQLLRGLKGVRITITPKTDSIVEWTDTSGIGKIAYVREVFPDNSIKIEGIGIIEDKYFESLRINEMLWKEWKPLFIEVM